MLDFLRTWLQYWIAGFHMGWWKWWNSPSKRALIMVREGVYYEMERAKLIYQGMLGQVWAYGDHVVYRYYSELKAEIIKIAEGHNPSQPILQQRYLRMTNDKARRRGRDDYEVYEDEQILFVVEGEVVCCPVQGTGVPMEADILSLFNMGHWGKQLAESIKEPSVGLSLGSMKWLLVIGAVVLILFVVYKFVLKGHLGAAGNITPTQTPTITPGKTPYFSMYQWLLWGLANA